MRSSGQCFRDLTPLLPPPLPPNAAANRYYFQRSALKRKFLLLTLYSSGVAAVASYLLEKASQYKLVSFDAFGQPFVYFRVLQWRVCVPRSPVTVKERPLRTSQDELARRCSPRRIHTTPAMLQSIASLADLHFREV